jgi:hypothetical protein
MEIPEGSKAHFKLRVALPERSIWWESEIYLIDDPPMLFVTVEDDQLFIGTIDNENERAGLIWPLFDNVLKGPITAHDVWVDGRKDRHGNS